MNLRDIVERWGNAAIAALELWQREREMHTYPHSRTGDNRSTFNRACQADCKEHFEAASSPLPSGANIDRLLY